MKFRSIGSAFLLAGLLSFLTGVPSRADDGARKHPVKLAIGQPAPAFTLADQDGKSVSLADYAGKIVVLEWFNEGCPYVQKFYESGKMNELAKAYQDKGVVWLAINTNQAKSSSRDNKSIAEKWKLDRPLLLDKESTVARAYGARSTPHMFVIDKDGKLAYAGAIDNQPSEDPATLAKADNYVADALDSLLAGKEVARPESKPYGCGVKY